MTKLRSSLSSVHEVAIDTYPDTRSPALDQDNKERDENILDFVIRVDPTCTRNRNSKEKSLAQRLLGKAHDL